MNRASPLFLAILLGGFGCAGAHPPKPIDPFVTMSAARIADEINRIERRAHGMLEQRVPRDGETKSVTAVLKYLRREPFVREAGVADGGAPTDLWIRYLNGMEGAVSYKKLGDR